MKRSVSDVRSEVILSLSETDRSKDRINGGLNTSFSLQSVSEKRWTAGSAVVEMDSVFND